MNTNGQLKSDKPSGQQIKKENSNSPNPKKEGNTPEKTNIPIKNIEIEPSKTKEEQIDIPHPHNIQAPDAEKKWDTLDGEKMQNDVTNQPDNSPIPNTKKKNTSE